MEKYWHGNKTEACLGLLDIIVASNKSPAGVVRTADGLKKKIRMMYPGMYILYFIFIFC